MNYARINDRGRFADSEASPLASDLNWGSAQPTTQPEDKTTSHSIRPQDGLNPLRELPRDNADVRKMCLRRPPPKRNIQSFHNSGSRADLCAHSASCHRKTLEALAAIGASHRVLNAETTLCGHSARRERGSRRRERFRKVTG